MILAMGLEPNGQRAFVFFLGGPEGALPRERFRQRDVHLRELRMLLAKLLLTDRQRLGHRLQGMVVGAQRHVQRGDGVMDSGDLGVLGAESLHADGQHPLVKVQRLLTLAELAENARQAVARACDIDVILAERLDAQVERPFERWAGHVPCLKLDVHFGNVLVAHCALDVVLLSLSHGALQRLLVQLECALVLSLREVRLREAAVDGGDVRLLVGQAQFDG
mmetsp:Transcript_90692/g.261338  ORF Transcript_90692/g.261338 Transcript_90692/m.261338 type:complete len:221 (-) Transcript_90692:1806-2468(-)